MTATAGLRHLDRVFLNFGNQTFQWVDVRRFTLPAPAADDATILALLIGHQQYGDDYAGGEPGGDPLRHGPYRRDRITPGRFDAISPASAEQQLRSWAGRSAPVPERLLPELERVVYQPLRSADAIHRLRDPDPADRHDWGGVHQEFHELALIDRPNHILTLVVAADD
jgi:hypothetical protein